MEEFINALKNFEVNDIIPTLDRIIDHIDKGYLTSEDKFFIDFCFPLLESSCRMQKLFLKGE